MREFHHVGVITTQKQPGEIYVPATKVYVTNPNDHPDRIEFLRFEDDTPLTGPVRDCGHVAFKVPKLEPEMARGQVLLGPFVPMENLRVVFVLWEGMVFEFMEFQGDHFFDGLQKKKIKSKANGKAKRPVAAAKKSKAKAGAKGKPKAKLAARGGKRR
jgi:hypothetical protein